jgi:hypothetical protein
MGRAFMDRHFMGCGAGETITPAFLPIPRRPRAALTSTILMCTVALAGCGLDDGPGSFVVDPGRYSVYHCKDLAARWVVLQGRESDLRNLMAKASEGDGGAVIGTLAYRADYEAVLTEEKLVQRQAMEKKCDLVPTYQSDQTIR